MYVNVAKAEEIFDRTGVIVYECEVTLNGRRMEYVVEADDQAGFVRVSNPGHISLDGREYVMQRLYGKVAITRKGAK